MRYINDFQVEKLEAENERLKEKLMTAREKILEERQRHTDQMEDLEAARDEERRQDAEQAKKQQKSGKKRQEEEEEVCTICKQTGESKFYIAIVKTYCNRAG